MSENQGIKEGPPIWVESLMTPTEWKERYKKFPSSQAKEPPQYNPTHYKGGTWRAGMGRVLSAEEIIRTNKGIDELRKYIITKQNESEKG